jgi:hypothetical protein
MNEETCCEEAGLELGAAWLRALEDPVLWAELYLPTERGLRLDLGRHPYMEQGLADWKTREWGMMCASQVGKTTMAVARAYWFADTRAATVIYTMHTAEEVRNFARTRAKPAIQFSKYLSARIGAVDAVEVKEFRPYDGHGASYIHFKGASADSQALSVPADMLIHDEVDYSRPDVIELYSDRIAHSSEGYRCYIGTPTYPGFPMARLWERSTQHEWHIRCPSCGHPDCELTWPDAAVVMGEDSYWACPKCQMPLLVEDILAGVWVAHGPEDAELRMYHVSRAMLPHLWGVERIAKAEAEAQYPRHFRNNVPGVPAVEGDRNLDELILGRCVGDYEEQTSHEGPCFAGVDVGRGLDCWVGRSNPDTGTRDWLAIISFATNTTDDFRQLGNVLQRFTVRSLIIDALPETRAVREFAAQFRGRVKRAYYQESRATAKQRDDTKRDASAHDVINVDRTAALDAAAERFIMAQDRLPKMTLDKEREVFGQLCNMARVIEEDNQTGEQRIVYQKVGPDHHRHAHSYGTQAAQSMTGGGHYASIRLDGTQSPVVIEEGGRRRRVIPRSVESINAELTQNWLRKNHPTYQAQDRAEEERRKAAMSEEAKQEQAALLAEHDRNMRQLDRLREKARKMAEEERQRQERR